MKLAIIFNQDKLFGKLTKFFTGEYAYHTGWVDEENGLIYDMHWKRRRRAWPRYEEDEIKLYDFPQVTREYLEFQLTMDNTSYGWKDYILFALKPIYHFFGKSTRNANGVICSEMCNIDMILCGVHTPFKLDDAPPSPADMYHWLNK